MLTRIRNIFCREGLTIGAVARAIGTIISTIFSIVCGTLYIASKTSIPLQPRPRSSQSQPQLQPQPQPQPEPKPEPPPKPEPIPEPETLTEKTKKNYNKYFE